MNLVLVDFPNLIYRALYSMNNVETEELPTALLFGVLEHIRSLAFSEHAQSNDLHFFVDSKLSHRRNAFPEYKAKRKTDKTQEELDRLEIAHSQSRLLCSKIFPAVGFRRYKQRGLEGDDLIAACVEDPKHANRNKVILSSDRDLWQCLADMRTTWISLQTEQTMTAMSFLAEYLITPDKWATVLSIAGCTTDGVPGVKGVGKKKAIQYLCKTLKIHHKAFQAIDTAFGNGEIAFWDSLVRLPHAETLVPNVRTPEYDADVFFEWCDRLELFPFLEGPKHAEWLRFFAGEMQSKPQHRVRKRRR